MVWTVVVHFVRELGHGNAILALLIRLMRLFALIFDFNEEMLEAFVLDIR